MTAVEATDRRGAASDGERCPVDASVASTAVTRNGAARAARAAVARAARLSSGPHIYSATSSLGSLGTIFTTASRARSPRVHVRLRALASARASSPGTPHPRDHRADNARSTRWTAHHTRAECRVVVVPLSCRPPSSSPLPSSVLLAAAARRHDRAPLPLPPPSPPPRASLVAWVERRSSRSSTGLNAAHLAR